MLLSLLPAFALLASVSADFIDGLPKCWRSCVKKTDLGCDGWDLPCICKASKGTFLTDTISCARSDCSSSDWDVQLFLSPLELLCDTVGQSIPKSIIKSAENCATQTASPTTPATTKTAEHASAIERHSDKSQDYITTTYTTTITETTTDSYGSTVYVIIPVIVEPSTLVYGKPSTSVAKGVDEPSTSTEESTVIVSPSPVGSSKAVPTATSGSPEAAQTQKQTGTATSSSKKGGPTNNSNGSPFSNPQAAASTTSRSWALAVFGLLVALC